MRAKGDTDLEVIREDLSSNSSQQFSPNFPLKLRNGQFWKMIDVVERKM